MSPKKQSGYESSPVETAASLSLEASTTTVVATARLLEIQAEDELVEAVKALSLEELTVHEKNMKEEKDRITEQMKVLTTQKKELEKVNKEVNDKQRRRRKQRQNGCTPTSSSGRARRFPSNCPDARPSRSSGCSSCSPPERRSQT